MSEFNITILESGVLFDGIAPRSGRHLICEYELQTCRYYGDRYAGTVKAECLGCGCMFKVKTYGLSGKTLSEVVDSFKCDGRSDRLKGDYSIPYCSDKCRKRIKRGYQPDRQPQPCQHCGTILATNNPKAKFCSAKCRVNASRSKTKAVQK